MPNHKSSDKRLRQSAKKRLRTYKKNCKSQEELENFTKGFDIKRLINKITPISEFKK